ncbi:MAG TPA: hypothetical protein VLE22_04600, partial [Bryobacteraceae bacterium]|nr:hypothetical protein [Bryobacteraceae bacterium]
MVPASHRSRPVISSGRSLGLPRTKTTSTNSTAINATVEVSRHGGASQVCLAPGPVERPFDGRRRVRDLRGGPDCDRR